MSRPGESARRTPAQVDAGRAASRRSNAAKYEEVRQWLNAVKLASGCIDCGYDAHPAALEFDHRDPSTKAFALSGSHTRSRAALEAEIAKCDVVCANCHRIRTERHRANSAITVGRPRSGVVAGSLFERAAS